MKLSKRLQTIADLVIKNSIVADIGSDHGYLVAYLVKNKIIKKAIASDINIGPVGNCKETIKKESLESSIDIRLGGGFSPYKIGDANVGIIAGMGGQLIRDIMIEDLEISRNLDYIILQPMTGQDVLRKYLIENNFEIINEVIINEQKRFYEIIVVKNSNKRTRISDSILNKINFKDIDIFLEIGFMVDIEKSNYLGFINNKISKYEIILKQIKKNKASNKDSIIKSEIVSKKLIKLNEVKECIQILIK